MEGKVERTRIAAQLPDPCNGCHECALRCSSGLQITRAEFDAIITHLKTLDSDRVRRIIEQEKNVPWFEDIYRECCLFLDVVKQDCLIYPARPEIGRFFGLVAWLPGTAGKQVSQLHDGWGVIKGYSKDTLKTFQEWQMETGMIDLVAEIRRT
jgi:hypothetical protein